MSGSTGETGQGATDEGIAKKRGATRVHTRVMRNRKADETRGAKGERLLTAIDESVVVLLECAVAVALLGEKDGSDALGAPGGVVVQRHFAQGPNGRVEEFLKEKVLSEPAL